MKFLLGSQILLRPLTNKQRLQSQCQSQGSGSAWLGYRTQGVFLPPILPRRRRCLVVRAASAAEGGSRRPASARRVYRESQSVSSLPVAPVKQLASFVVPASSFFAVTFGFGAKIERESKLKLNDFAKELRSFRSVDLSGRNFGDEGLFFLSESLGYNQTAEEVSFAANGITGTGMKAFDGVLQSNIMLKTLNLSGNPIGDEGIKCLCDILLNNNGIQKLQLNSTDLGDEGAKAIAELLKNNSSLRVLELNNNMIDYSVGIYKSCWSSVENNTIRNIHLNGNYGGALGANALAKGLEGNKSLRELHLHGNSIGDEGVAALMSGLSLHKGKLTLLDIGNNSFSAKGAFHVGGYVKKTKSLLWLNVYMNDIGDEGAENIADALKQNRTITTTDLGGNNIHAKGVTAIAEALKDNSVITFLELGYNPMGPDGVKALSEVLKFHGNIETLKLGWCQIGAKGAEFIADMLKYNTTIRVLDLRANGLRNEGASCLARSLKVVNEALSSLDLGSMKSGYDDGAFAIAQALKANEDVTVTSLNLASNFLTKFGQSALTDARDHEAWYQDQPRKEEWWCLYKLETGAACACLTLETTFMSWLGPWTVVSPHHRLIV
ncbi:protein NLRC3 isoform X1 [Prunus yedoensis var. nudiflora]|uniref:Protein NLRC3 isoform X1 n=1 Tax=Prunus yedoensis var. nudiflora TaxID=2094558 RepID=A0A314YHR1_PRUYE|nr:protein NLRC3 isoform X1 [Prunus yedoensis var. nudiflora]